MEIRPEFQPRVAGLVFESEGSALADAIRRLHNFSIKRGLRPITDFLDNRDMPEDDMDEDEWQGSRQDWHAPADGLAVVQALVEAIEADPKASQRWNKDDPDGLETLMQDLQALTACLQAAASHNVQFRLEIC